MVNAYQLIYIINFYFVYRPRTQGDFNFHILHTQKRFNIERFFIFPSDMLKIGFFVKARQVDKNLTKFHQSSTHTLLYTVVNRNRTELNPYPLLYI